MPCCNEELLHHWVSYCSLWELQFRMEWLMKQANSGEPPVWFVPESSTRRIGSDLRRLQSAASSRNFASETKLGRIGASKSGRRARPSFGGIKKSRADSVLPRRKKAKLARPPQVQINILSDVTWSLFPEQGQGSADNLPTLAKNDKQSRELTDSASHEKTVTMINEWHRHGHQKWPWSTSLHVPLCVFDHSKTESSSHLCYIDRGS